MKKIQILGTGCPKCQTLAANAAEAVRELSGEFELEKVTDVAEIVKFGAMLTPALAIDGELKAAGKILTAEEIRALLL